MEIKKDISKNKEVDIRDLTICEATAQMLAKARRDGVETAFDRAINMKAPSGRIRPAASIAPWGPADSMPRTLMEKSAYAGQLSIRSWRAILPAWSPAALPLTPTTA